MPKQKTQKNKGLRILKLQAENVKKIKVVEITPEGDAVIVSGRNGQGKTSVLDCIWYALGGKKAIAKVPIRKGEKKASIRTELGTKENKKVEYVIDRIWTDNEHSYLEVRAGDGGMFSTPQKLLDGLIGVLSFDPLEFARSDKKDQRDILMLAGKMRADWEKLKSLTGSDWSHYGNYIDGIDAATSSIFDSRTEINRRVKSLANQLDAIEIPDEFEDTKPVEMSKLLDQQKAVDRLRVLNREIEDTERRIDELIESSKKLHQQRGALVAKGVDVKNEKAIREKVEKADEINEYARIAEQKKSLMKDHKENADASERFTDIIDKLRQLKTDVVAKSKLPIEDLGFSEDGVTYKDLPLEQVSDSEKLKISMAIAMALNPKIRVIRITDGSLLDKDSMRIIEQMAKDKDFQVWVESVSDEPGKVGVFISEGEVVAIDGKGIVKD